MEDLAIIFVGSGFVILLIALIWGVLWLWFEAEAHILSLFIVFYILFTVGIILHQTSKEKQNDKEKRQCVCSDRFHGEEDSRDASIERESSKATPGD